MGCEVFERIPFDRETIPVMTLADHDGEGRTNNETSRVN